MATSLYNEQYINDGDYRARQVNAETLFDVGNRNCLSWSGREGSGR